MSEPGSSLLMGEQAGTTLLDIEPVGESVTAMVRDVGLSLRLARERQDLLQTQVAEQAGVSASVLSRLERAVRDAPLATVLAVCQALKVRLSDVMRLVEDLNFPAGDGPWTRFPEVLIGYGIPSSDVAVDVLRRELLTTHDD